MSPLFRPDSLLGRLTGAKREGRSVAPIDLSWFRQQGMPALFKPQQSLQAYGDNVWLYRAVLSIAMEIASIDFKLRRVTAAGEHEPVLKHQALETLRLPQPTVGGKSMLTGMLLKMVTGMHLMLNGEAFWLLDRRMKVNGAPTFVMPLLAQNMRVEVSDDGSVLEYIYRLQTREMRYDPMDVVHFRLPDPENLYRGHSPVQGIRYAVDTHKKADEMNTSKLDNYAAPSGVLKSGQGIGEAERKKLLAEFKQVYGGTRNAGKTAMLPYGLDFVKTQESNQDMQFIEGKHAVRDEILANYGIGMEIMGKTESQTRANADTAVFVFMRFGVSPFAKLFNDTLSNDYLAAFPGVDGMEYWYDDPVPENVDEKRQTADSLFAGGALTPNERRKMFGLEPLDFPGMDVPYIPMNLVPVDNPQPDPLTASNTNNASGT